MAKILLKKSISAETHGVVREESSQEAATPQRASSSSLWDFFELKKIEQEIPVCTLEQLKESQVDQYLSEPLVHCDGNPLRWWTANKLHYEHMVPAASHYLAIPATEVASKRAFSTAGNVVSDKRARLMPEHVEQQICIQNFASS